MGLGLGASLGVSYLPTSIRAAAERARFVSYLPCSHINGVTRLLQQHDGVSLVSLRRFHFYGDMASLSVSIDDSDVIKMMEEFLTNRHLDIALMCLERESAVINGQYGAVHKLCAHNVRPNIRPSIVMHISTALRWAPIEEVGSLMLKALRPATHLGPIVCRFDHLL